MLTYIQLRFWCGSMEVDTLQALKQAVEIQLVLLLRAKSTITKESSMLP
jgi:hypothetical protein